MAKKLQVSSEEPRQVPAISFSIPDDYLRAMEDSIVEKLFEKLKTVANNKDGEETIFTVDTLAQYLQVDVSWVYKRVSLNDIPYFKVGKYTRFLKKKIDEWIDKNSVRVVS